MKKYSLKNAKGFSLVELLVVITIIAILSVVAYTAVGGQTIKAKDSKRKQDIATIQKALELYFAENAGYPAALTDFTAKQLSQLPKDPGSAGVDYIYVRSGVSYELAATLEGDGDIANYEAYVVGNSDSPLIMTDSTGVTSFFNNSGALDDCSLGGPFEIQSGNIRTNAANADDPADSGSCIPYNPNN